MELFQVMSRPEQKEWGGPRLAFDEVGVGFVPDVPDGALVDDVDLGRLVFDQELGRQAGGRELLVVGNVLPVEAEILGGEGLTVRPFVAAAQLEGDSRLSLAS
jgi:hypothetical protein